MNKTYNVWIGSISIASHRAMSKMPNFFLQRLCFKIQGLIAKRITLVYTCVYYLTHIFVYMQFVTLNYTFRR